MKRRLHERGGRRLGVILLVVLVGLTCFSLLVATYVVFSSESRRASFALTQRTTRSPDVHWMMNEALMTLVRGTGDPNSPFFGEDLLSDYYGHDGVSLRVKHLANHAAGPQLVGNGFIRFPVACASSGGVNRFPGLEPIDDVYSGSLVTFTEGPLRHQTYRVLRSVFRSGTVGPPAIAAYDDLYIEVRQGLLSGTSPTASSVRSLFYADPTNPALGGFALHINGAPRNSPGIGFDGTNVNASTRDPASPAITQPRDPSQAYDAAANPGAGLDLPVALQPNHLGRHVDKSATPGDFDEDYDAPDFNNWFLSHRRTDGSIIPSFHRPAVINYILNEHPDWLTASSTQHQDLVVSLARGTFRPLPIAPNQLAPGSIAVNERFTGGSAALALRTALPLIDHAPPPTSGTVLRPVLLDQLMGALVTGPWDVDNDFDGMPDSNWIDLGLPTFTTREGKLVRPLVAPMIEDLGGRLNLNAHGNLALRTGVAGMNSQSALWAGAYGALGSAGNSRGVFRGLGWGPAEIMPPATCSTWATTSPADRAAIRAALADLLNDRYRHGQQPLANPEPPGVRGRDLLDLLRFGYRPPGHTSAFGFGYSTDPFGRGGLAIGRSGHILAAGSGTPVSVTINEAVETPYESDPTGNIGGDHPFTLAELEAILRSNEFDAELLPQALRQRLQLLLVTSPEFAHSFTSISVSDDRPASVPPTGWIAATSYYIGDQVMTAGGQLLRCVSPGTSGITAPLGPGQDGSVTWAECESRASPFLSLVNLIDRSIAPSGCYRRDQWNQLIAPELRLGRKLDVNRPFGNRVDDDDDGVIDEPTEVAAETDAYGRTRDWNAKIPGEFKSQRPNYTFDEPATAAGAIPVTGRQLLARHLYILVMALSRDPDNPSREAFLRSIDSPPPPSFDKSMYKARRLAQWAVNVVDYRDPDAIMTRFVFDDTPFDTDGWSPPMDTFASPAPSDHVVWGVEQPQLVFSESAAYHDVRLRDIERDDNEAAKKNPDPSLSITDGQPPPDDDSDQVRMPQGSLFLELYCPHPVVNGDQETKPGTPQELFTTVRATGVSELDLARSAPPSTAGVSGAPVWRIAISGRHDAFSQHVIGREPAHVDPNRVRKANPDSFSFEPAVPDELYPTAGSLPMDRFILFRDFANADADPDGAHFAIGNLIRANSIRDMMPHQVFFAPGFRGDPVTNLDRMLEPGQFLVLAPRLETRFGSKQYGGRIPGVPSEQRLSVFAGQGLVQVDHDNRRLTPTLAATAACTPALPLVIAAPRPAGWIVPNAAHPNFTRNVVGLNVSEPLPRGGNYYPQPAFRYNGSEDVDNSGGQDYPLTDAYIDFSESDSKAIDTPLDLGRDRIPVPLGAGEPRLGTVANYCSAFLQRLADPTIPYHAVTNPYRTVDWIPIDLSVFSGEDRASSISSDSGYTPRTRQRNGHVKTAGGTTAANALYSYETHFDETAPARLDASSNEFFQFAASAGTTHLQSSLSFLNTPAAVVNPAPFVGFDAPIGSLGAAAGGVVGNDRNLPRTPYAVHPWLNRPFASHFELMMVPACSQGRLFEEFAFDPVADPEIYPAGFAPPDPTLRAPFRHLLSFFHSNPGGDTSVELARLLDYVHTLPRFRGEVELIHPQRVNRANPQIAEMTGSILDPPFAFRYDNTRQGTVNLNTLSQFPVWAGLMQGHLRQGEFADPSGDPVASHRGTPTQLSFENFIQNRRGYMVPLIPPGSRKISAGAPYNYDPANLDHRFPTEFAGVFRSATHTPLVISVRSSASPGTGTLRRRPVHGTLHRGAGTLDENEKPTSPPVQSLFVRAGTETPRPRTNPMHDRFRNAFMRYQTLMRMPNLVSDNSQVFLIRMTLGLFEVDAQTGSLQNEYNVDIGQNTRYHALFVVDRSIPVGFIPGQDLNARDIVIFESYSQ